VLELEVVVGVVDVGVVVVVEAVIVVGEVAIVVVDVVIVVGVRVVVVKASAQVATPCRRQSRKMGRRHFRNALPFGGQTSETIGAQALRQMRNAVRASAIEPRSRTARSRETLRGTQL
jgi:hypothetical protein